MSPALYKLIEEAVGFPRVSGDEPLTNEIQSCSTLFSPRERG